MSEFSRGFSYREMADDLDLDEAVGAYWRNRPRASAEPVDQGHEARIVELTAERDALQRQRDVWRREAGRRLEEIKAWRKEAAQEVQRVWALEDELSAEREAHAHTEDARRELEQQLRAHREGRKEQLYEIQELPHRHRRVV